jgi:hypothetical protein
VERNEMILAFNQLGKLMVSAGKNEAWSGYASGVTELEYTNFLGLVAKQHIYNPWFTKENVQQSLIALGENLAIDKLSAWTSNYTFSNTPKRIALVMAGNIPLVGFHDFLCVILAGHSPVCKLSSDDKQLLPAIASFLIQFAPDLKERISFSTGRISDFDAVIATGSDNSLKYFEQYFGKYPHIFRKNRTSIAIISESTSDEELKALGFDIFNYFGLGCRNVSHLLVPKDFEINRFFEAIVDYFQIVNHNKYANNYDYNKAVYLLNQMPLLDNNFVLLRETEELHSPLGMIHYHFYESQKEIDAYITTNENSLQAIVGENYIPFGKAQKPELSDYPDGVDVMEWLGGLK